MKYGWLSLGLLVCCALASGCARAARDTTGFAMEDSAVIEAPFEDAWQMTKAVLREQALDIYTRDKRGTFVAYTPMERGILNPTPSRTQFTLVLEDLNNNTTQLHASTVDQIHGVTLLTYPGWHDRKTTDNSRTVAIIEAIQAKAAGGYATPTIEERAAMPETVVDREPADTLGAPQKQRKWYRKLNPASWFGRKDEAPTIQEQQSPVTAPAEPAEEPAVRPLESAPGEINAPTPDPIGAVDDEAIAPRDDDMEEAPRRRWYNRLNPKNWF